MNRVNRSINLNDIWSDFDKPQSGQQFKHYKGGLYTVLTTGLLEDSLQPAVVYQSNTDETVWIRSAEDFFAKINIENESQQRFILEEEKQ